MAGGAALSRPLPQSAAMAARAGAHGTDPRVGPASLPAPPGAKNRCPRPAWEPDRPSHARVRRGRSARKPRSRGALPPGPPGPVSRPKGLGTGRGAPGEGWRPYHGNPLWAAPAPQAGPSRYRSSLPPGPAQRPHQGQRAARVGRESPPAAQGEGEEGPHPRRPRGGAVRYPSTFPPPPPRLPQDGGGCLTGQRWPVRAPVGLREAGARAARETGSGSGSGGSAAGRPQRSLRNAPLLPAGSRARPGAEA